MELDVHAIKYVVPVPLRECFNGEELETLTRMSQVHMLWWLGRDLRNKRSTTYLITHCLMFPKIKTVFTPVGMCLHCNTCPKYCMLHLSNKNYRGIRKIFLFLGYFFVLYFSFFRLSFDLPCRIGIMLLSGPWERKRRQQHSMPEPQ